MIPLHTLLYETSSFKAFDKDGDNTITKDEFDKAMLSLGFKLRDADEVHSPQLTPTL